MNPNGRTYQAALAEALAGTGQVMAGIGRLDPVATDAVPLKGKALALATRAMESHLTNPWFIPRFTLHAMRAWGEVLKEDQIESWLSAYPNVSDRKAQSKRIGLVMAGNLPMVGLHDLLCVIAAGHDAIVKLSSQDQLLIPAVIDLLDEFLPGTGKRVTFAEGTLSGFDAVIATGSNNTARYFEYYFGKYPRIIRRNRNGIAVITGKESPSWYRALADDLFLYFGLGCRSISKIYIPEGFDFNQVMAHFHDFDFLADQHKYRNNYDYQKSIFMVNGMEFLDNGFLLARMSESIASPVSVVNLETYTDLSSLRYKLSLLADQVQCTVTEEAGIEGRVRAGETQTPRLWDYADGVDTMRFLSDL